MDKNKIIEGAAKLVAKGAFDKAIKEYQKVLDSDPKDVRVLQKMGELFQKKNDNGQAAHYFTKVAESYSTDGFFLKAVALYKQVLKLDPNLVEVNLKLAELHQQLGLMSEAMAYFQLVANHYDKAGDTKSSLDTLKKMVDLDPDNVASRIKLAELYARESMNKDALAEFKRASEYLKKNNRSDDYLRVAERISSLEPDNLALAKELAQGFLQKGDQKRALAKLQVCFKADPRDVETLTLLAQAFHGLGQGSKTISVYKELAKVYQDKGQGADEQKVWAKIRTLDPNDADLLAREAPPPRSAAPAPAPAAQPPPRSSPSSANIPAPGPPPRATYTPAPVRSSASAGRDQLAKLLTETDVYVKYGLHDKALEHLRKVFAIDPENLDAHEKAYHIYLGSNNHAQASEQLLNVLRLCTRRSEIERAQPYLATILNDNPAHPEVPAFLAVLRTDQTPAAPERETDEAAILVDSNEEEIIVADAPEDALAGAADDMSIRAAAAGEDADEVVEDDELLSTGEVEPPAGADEPLSTEDEAAELVVEDDEEESVTTSFDDDVVSGLQVPDDEAEEFVSAEMEVPEELVEEPRTTMDRSVRAPEPPAPVPTFQREAAGTEPNLKRAPPPLGKEAPTNIQASKQLTGLGVTMDGPTRIESFPPPRTAAKGLGRSEPTLAAPLPKPPPIPEPAPPPPEPEPAADEGGAEECDEAAFFIDQGLLEEAREVLETVLIAFPNHGRAAELMQRLEEQEASGASPASEEPTGDQALPSVAPVTEDDAPADVASSDAFDLAAELAGELGDTAADVSSSSGSDSEDFQYSVEEVFSEFKKGLEKVVKPEDVETHYDLGIAYKEMGLIDDAISEMKTAAAGCIGQKREVDCILMAGVLQAMKGDHAAAEDSFKQGLSSEHGQAGESFKALAYELGAAHEALGKPGKAIFWFQKIVKQDANYRDVASIVSRLGKAKPEDDPVPPRTGGPPNGANGAHAGGAGGKTAVTAPPKPDPSKARKVGYV